MDLTPQQLGKKLLDEVEELGFDKLLYDTWAKRNAQRRQAWYGITKIDDIVHEISRRRDEYTPPVLELVSAASGVGKSHILYYTIAHAILKQRGHQSGHVILLDCDNTFEVQRLASTLAVLFAARSADAGDDPASASRETITNLLRNVQIYRPTSLAATVAVCENLELRLLQLSKSPAGLHQVSLIAIDSISAFYWQQVNNDEAAKLDQDDSQHSEDFSYHAPIPDVFSRIVKALTSLQQTFDVPIIATSWALTVHPSQRQNQVCVRTYIPPVWQSFVTAQLVIEKSAVNRFPSGMSVRQAGEDKDARMDVVAAGKHAAYPEQANTAKWPAGAYESVQQAMGPCFWFHLGGDLSFE